MYITCNFFKNFGVLIQGFTILRGIGLPICFVGRLLPIFFFSSTLCGSCTLTSCGPYQTVVTGTRLFTCVRGGSQVQTTTRGIHRGTTQVGIIIFVNRATSRTRGGLTLVRNGLLNGLNWVLHLFSGGNLQLVQHSLTSIQGDLTWFLFAVILQGVTCNIRLGCTIFRRGFPHNGRQLQDSLFRIFRGFIFNGSMSFINARHLRRADRHV